MFKGQEELNGQTCRIWVLKLSVQDLMIECFWTGLEYTLYVGKDNKTVMKTKVSVKNEQRNR